MKIVIRFLDIALNLPLSCPAGDENEPAERRVLLPAAGGEFYGDEEALAHPSTLSNRSKSYESSFVNMQGVDYSLMIWSAESWNPT